MERKDAYKGQRVRLTRPPSSGLLGTIVSLEANYKGTDCVLVSFDDKDALGGITGYCTIALGDIEPYKGKGIRECCYCNGDGYVDVERPYILEPMLKSEYGGVPVKITGWDYCKYSDGTVRINYKGIFDSPDPRRKGRRDTVGGILDEMLE